MPETTDWTKTTIDSDTLVSRLRDPGDEAAWARVDARYGPMLVAFGRRLGLDADSCQDARQEAMSAFAQAIRAGQFERERGRLRDFLFGIARNKVRDLRKRSARNPQQVVPEPDQTGFFERLPDHGELEQVWEAEWQLAVAAQCLQEARQKFTADTYQTFHLRMIEDLPSEEVARRLGKTVNAVDLAVHHVRAFLRRIRPAIEEIF